MTQYLSSGTHKNDEEISKTVLFIKLNIPKYFSVKLLAFNIHISLFTKQKGQECMTI